MHHFFLAASQIDWENKSGYITGSDVHHIVDVLRLPLNSVISVSDGMDRRYTAMIREIQEEQLFLSLLDNLPAYESTKALPVRLVQGVAKGSKMDWIIQKNTEMGISAIQPITTQFTVVKFPTNQDAVKKQDRWQKIATEASKQSKRTTIPTIEKAISLEDYVKNSRKMRERWLRLLAYERESGKQLRELIEPAALQHYEGVELWIGPEGGFSKEEIEIVKEAGIQTIGLGPRILRTETASIALLAIILYEMGVLEA